MSKEEFISKVEYLLSDIPNEEKYEAIQYYRDYLEEAGPDKEEEVLAEFGSPERIAAIIRSDLTGNMADGGEFTENGYKDPRFDGPDNSIVTSAKVTEKKSFWEKFKEKVNNMFGDNMSKTTKIVILVVLLILLFPVIFGTGSFLLSVLGSIVGFVLSMLVAVGLVTIGLFVGSIVVLFTAFGFMFVNGGIAALLFGVAITAFGLGMLCLVLSVLFYGRFIPFLYRKIKSLFTKEEN